MIRLGGERSTPKAMAEHLISTALYRMNRTWEHEFGSDMTDLELNAVKIQLEKKFIEIDPDLTPLG